MSKTKLVRVLVGPTEIAGYYASLVAGFNQNGCRATYGVLNTNRFGYGGVYRPGLLRGLALRLWDWAESHRNHRLPWIAARLLHQVLSGIYLLAQLPRIDAVVMGFGHSYWPANLDIPVLRLLGKRVIVNLGHGSDMRPPYLDGSYLSADGAEMPAPAWLAERARVLSLRARRCSRWADWVIGQPLSSSHFGCQTMVNWFAIGWPYQPAELAVTADALSPVAGRPWRLLHAPSKPALKGTATIRAAVAQLRAAGYAIEYTEIQGRPNHEVLACLQHCDLVLDQLYSDTPMAGLAVEAAAFGKPALVAGYGFEQLRCHVPPECWPPSFTCLPEAFADTLEQILRDPAEVQCKGREAQRFIAQHWLLIAVAQRYLKLIAGTAPQTWLFDPQRVHYLYGCGLSAQRVADTVAAVVDGVGLSGLQLGHRPDLERAYLDLVRQPGLAPAL
jgi:glycosyltransferase involved in cell wall biosynthesis